MNDTVFTMHPTFLYTTVQNYDQFCNPNLVAAGLYIGTASYNMHTSRYRPEQLYPVIRSISSPVFSARMSATPLVSCGTTSRATRYSTCAFPRAGSHRTVGSPWNAPMDAASRKETGKGQRRSLFLRLWLQYAPWGLQ